jgi:hypothetical protein
MGDSAFTGKYEPSKDGLDYVAVFDGATFRLELLGAAVKSLRCVGGCAGGGVFGSVSAALLFLLPAGTAAMSLCGRRRTALAPQQEVGGAAWQAATL